MWTLILICLIIFFIISMASTYDPYEGIGQKKDQELDDDMKPLPPYLYDPKYDYNIDGKMDSWEKFCQKDAWYKYQYERDHKNDSK